jgi:chromo domain-containing protein 1
MASHEAPAAVSSLRMKQLIDQFMKITFTDLFAWGENSAGKIMFDRRACLLFHPGSHLKSLNLITRWLLLHHVEVSSPWYAGFWEYYTQQLYEGGSGIIIVSHYPSYLFVGT